jgi:DNA mismatch endonuclease, patch repair protein
VDDAPNGAAPVPATPGRRRNMQAIRRTGTKPEIALRSALHRLGYRFRKDFRLLASGVYVRPDIVFTRRRIAIFVDGCFWHVCPQHGRPPTRNEWYWTPKLRKNMERDTRANDALRAAGWQVIRVWEHEAIDEVVESVVDVLSETEGTLTAPGAAPRG